MSGSPFAESWKFCPVNENTFSILINKEIWFSRPRLFNDPFDCQVDVDAVFDGVERVLAERGSEGLNAFREGLRSHAKRDIYAYFCTCKNWHHSLMWSHYAKNHEGIALGFTFDVDSPVNIRELNIKDVEYDTRALWKAIEELNAAYIQHAANRPSTHGLLATESDEVTHNFTNAWIRLFEIVRFMKAECWGYEDELRYEVELDEGETSDGVVRSFNPLDLKHVIFGLNCNDRNRKTILGLLNREEWGHVKKWDSQRNPVELKIECEEYKI